MYPLYFSAVLKTGDGKFLETGEACLAETENAVLFNSDFVPLMKLGTPAQIVRVLNGGTEELECFSGSVYLSSRKLLQITDVDPETIRQAREIFCVNENLPVQLMLATGTAADFVPQKAPRAAGHLRYVSQDCFKLMTLEPVSQGQLLAFSVYAPHLALQECKLLVTSRTQLKKNTAILHCKPVELSAEHRHVITEYLDRGKPSPIL